MSQAPRIVVWGTYDLGKPRVRILLRGLREQGIALHECHADVWSRVEDKSQISGQWLRLWLGVRWLFSYPRLLWCYLTAPPHDWVLVPYLGHLDVLVIWLFAKWRRARVVWDVFVPLYEAVVEDRRLLGKRNPLAWALYAWEWLASRAATLVILDTRAHADYFRAQYRLDTARIGVVLVGAELDKFPFQPRTPSIPSGAPCVVLFYGQLIPLHGVDTIIEAARLLDDGSVRWVLIGKGQESARVRQMLAEAPLRHLEWHPWVPYEELIDWIQKADVCLGVFGDSPKAARVIPNKVFQALSAGRPIITRDSPAVHDSLLGLPSELCLVPPSNPRALAAAVRETCAMRYRAAGGGTDEGTASCISPLAVGRQLLQWLSSAPR